MMKIPQRTWKSCLPAALLFALVGLLGLAGLVYLGTQAGLVDLSRIAWPDWLSPQRTALVVNVQPDGAEVRLDGQPAGVTPLTLHVSPGAHDLLVQAEGYLPWTTRVQAVNNEELRFDHRLVYRPQVTRLAVTAQLPAWDAGGNLHYIDASNGYRWVRLDGSGVTTELGALPGEPRHAWLSPDGTRMLVSLTSGDSPAGMLLSAGAASVDLSVTAQAVVWAADSRSFHLLGTSVTPGEVVNPDAPLSGTLGLWQGAPDGRLVELPFTAGGSSAFASALAFSPDGRYLAAGSAGALELWMESAWGPSYVTGITPAYWVGWWGGRALYLTEAGALHAFDPALTTDEDLNLTALPPLRLMPDGELVYVTTNPSEGGSAFWRVNLDNGARELLNEAALIPPAVSDFAVSPDGLRIAFVDAYGRLWRLDLAPAR